MNITPLQPVTARHGFTLIEMLVVVALIAGLLTLTIPTVNMLTRTSRGQASMNSISVAVAAARAYATRTKPAPTEIPLAKFSGVAILFAPSGELRLVENDLYAVSNTNTVLEPTLNGYSDLQGREYVVMPKRSGVVGIARLIVGGVPKLVLLPPPFAVRFNEYGQQVTGDTVPTDTDRIVYYDGNNDGEFQTSGASPAYNRTSAYVPDQWDPESGSFVAANYDATNKKYMLPFEAIEAVIGVIAYSKADFQAANPGLSMPYQAYDTLTPSDPETRAYNWLLAPDTTRPGKLLNGTQIFFSRYSGAMMREQ